MADRMKRPATRPPERPARAGGLGQAGRTHARARRGPGQPAIVSARAPSRLTGARLVTTALVVAAALGPGVLFRGRLAMPPEAGPAEPRSVVRPAGDAEA